jgi:predicted transcriptional regulator
MRHHTPAYASIRQHTPAYACIRQQNAEFGSEAQMEKFKGVMLKAKNTTQAKLQCLESKIENIEKLLKKVAQNLDGHNASFPTTVGDG